MAIACTRFGLSPEEALVMSTLNAAWALGHADEIGSLAPGKRCDAVILRGSSVDEMCHHLGLDEVDRVFLGGQEVVRRRRGFPRTT
jgi:imidazolonepropionase